MALHVPKNKTISTKSSLCANRVFLHYLNNLDLHVFRQLGELKRKFSNLIGPYQWLHMRFQFILAILTKLIFIDKYSFQSTEKKTISLKTLNFSFAFSQFLHEKLS